METQVTFRGGAKVGGFAAVMALCSQGMIGCVAEVGSIHDDGDDASQGAVQDEGLNLRVLRTAEGDGLLDTAEGEPAVPPGGPQCVDCWIECRNTFNNICMPTANTIRLNCNEGHRVTYEGCCSACGYNGQCLEECLDEYQNGILLCAAVYLIDVADCVARRASCYGQCVGGGLCKWVFGRAD